MDIKRLLKPKAIAIVGANEKNGSFGNYSALNALQNSDDVHVYFVNAKKDFVLGRKAYKSLSDLPEVPDSIMLVTPKASIPGLMEEAGQLGVGGVIIVAAGYSEEGTEEGRADEEVIVDIAKKYDMAVMGPNCTGYVNNVGKVKMWGMGGTEFNMAERGTGIAFFAQSGTMAIHALSCNYVDISYVFSMGNSVMLSIEDLMEYAVEDPEVNMLCLYLEGVRHGRRFMNVLKRARELGKPVIIHASGMSKKGAIAAASHTGNLASSRNVYKAVCEKYGVVLVESIDEFLCAANVLSAWHGHMPKGGRIAAVNGSGGENAVCAELGELYDVPMPDLQPETIAKLKAVLPEFASPRNPLDMTAITSDTEKSAALITDGRFSGVTTGAVIGHVSPEAALGGPIGLVQDGDIIEYDTIEGYINLLVSEEELEKRRAEWKPLPPRVTTGYLAKYASMVGTASHGARVVAKL